MTVEQSGFQRLLKMPTKFGEKKVKIYLLPLTGLAF